MKKLKGFSLIELLISLIVISVIIASFVPIMTKRLSKTSITLGSGDSAITNECSSFGDDCKLCNKDKCLFCDANCLSNQYKDAVDCKCVDCTQTFGAECKACSALSCTACSDYFEVSGTGCALLSCPDGTYLSGSTCPACSAFHLKCTKCNATEGCTECAAGYIPVNGKCNKKVTQEDCTSKFDGVWDGFNSICVTKRNMGYSADGSSTEKYKEIPIPTEAGVSSAFIGAACLETTNNQSKCCWYGFTEAGSYVTGGNTAGSSSDLTASNRGGMPVSPAYTYSASKRTVCNWYAAKAICQTYNGGGALGYWRLPAEKEIRRWYSIKNKLQLCDNYTSREEAPKCSEQAEVCRYYTVKLDSYPAAIWCETIDSYNQASFVLIYDGGITTDATMYAFQGASVRCVIDNFPSD